MAGTQYLSKVCRRCLFDWRDPAEGNNEAILDIVCCNVDLTLKRGKKYS